MKRFDQSIKSMNILQSERNFTSYVEIIYHQISGNFMNLISKAVKQSTSDRFDRCLPFQFSTYSSLWIRPFQRHPIHPLIKSDQSIQWLWPVEASYLHVCRELDYNLDCTTTTLANYVAHCRTTQKVLKLKRPRDKLVVLQIHFWCSLMARPGPVLSGFWQWHLVAPLPCKELRLEALPNTFAATHFRSPAWQVIRTGT